MKRTTVALCLLLVGCAQKGKEQKSTDNARFDVDRLFSVDGCNVYRFHDAGHYRYFASCRGSITGNRSCGKNCTIDDTITTKEDSQ